MTKAVNGDGSIYKRPSGTWQGQAYVTDSNGRRVRRSFSGASKREVERKIADVIRQEKRGQRQPASGLTVDVYMREWLDQVVATRVRPTTLKTYRFMTERYVIPGIGRSRLEAVSARQLRTFYDKLRKAGTGERTIRYVHTTIRAALEDAVREEVLERNPAKLVRLPAAPKSEVKPLDVDEIKQLLRFHRDRPHYALLVTLALLGLRRSEALGLRWDDVDLVGETLQINRGLHRIDGHLITMPTKTARSQRTVPLPGLVVQAMKTQQQRQADDRDKHGMDWQDTGYVFTTGIGTPLDPRNTTRIVQAACREAKVRVVRLHDFRHGCVSLLLSLGVPPRTAMEIVGHSSLEMTMNVYGHVSHAERRAALDRVDELYADSGN
ncbi:tyrosine-type recombinase/integrase [Nocardioides bruguierae]|uniref:tyrosine-type recombinase/integrase n=1 Tax=Nocardioides bruguierae TaxID=2945102 RepID=UPI002020113F|nr:tyrosine-type recombinase/integrase [Nocardioides bruguierae]MCL8026050.1 site-specific integrase [Nocardioides bruguierae]